MKMAFSEKSAQKAMLISIENGCDCVGDVLKKRGMTSANVRVGRAIEEDMMKIFNSTSTAYRANPMLPVKPLKTASVHT